MELDDEHAGELLAVLEDYRRLLLTHGLVISEAADLRERDVKLRRAGELAAVLERGLVDASPRPRRRRIPPPPRPGDADRPS